MSNTVPAGRPPKPREVVADAIKYVAEADPQFNYWTLADTIIGRLREAGYVIVDTLDSTPEPVPPNVEGFGIQGRAQGPVAVQRPGSGAN